MQQMQQNQPLLRVYAKVCQEQGDRECKEPYQYMKYNIQIKKTGRIQMMTLMNEIEYFIAGPEKEADMKASAILSQ